MINLKKIESDEDFQKLQEIIEETRTCQVLVSVYQYIDLSEEEKERTGEEYATNTIEQFVIDSNNAPFPNGKYMYLDLHPFNAVDCNNIIGAWRTVLDRGEVRFAHNLENDYLMRVELVKTKETEGIIYDLCFNAPEFVSRMEDGCVQLAFLFENIHIEKQEIDFVEIYDELEYEDEEERFAEERELAREQGYTETDDILSNDSILSNDDLL